MSRGDHLARLAAARDVCWPHADGRVVLLTGQSRLARSPLSPAQAEFLAAVTPPRFEAVQAGLPYLPTPVEPPPSVLAGSWNNARQYVWAHRGPRYARAVAEAMSPLLRASRAAMIVTGSMGLALLQRAWPDLARSAPDLLAIVCLGPAGAAPAFGPGVAVEVVQGARDGWSRALYRGPVTRQVDCGHLGYWDDPDVRAVARAAAERLLAKAAP